MPLDDEGLTTMSPKSLMTLKAAVDLVDEAHRRSDDPEAVIKQLIELHGAKRTLSPSGNTLRCGTVSASCTWSTGAGLLVGWRRLAGCALQVEARK